MTVSGKVRKVEMREQAVSRLGLEKAAAMKTACLSRCIGNRPMNDPERPPFWISVLRLLASFVNSWVHFVPLVLVRNRRVGRLHLPTFWRVARGQMKPAHPTQLPDKRLGELGCAFVVAKPGTTPTLESLTAFLRDRQVSRTSWPERLELLDAMPMTASGKIQKFVLRERVRALVVKQA